MSVFYKKFLGIFILLFSMQVVNSQQCDALSFTVTVDESYCLSGGFAGINASVSGGTGPYSYSLLDGQGVVRESANVSSSSYVFIVPHDRYENGTYVIRLVDANNCVVQDNVEIALFQSQELFYNSINVSCFGQNDGEIRIQNNASISFLEYTLSNLDDNSIISGTFDLPPYEFKGLIPGEYLLFLSDGICSDEYITIISEPTILEAIVTVDQNVSCQGDDGVIIAQSIGGTAPYTYSVSQGGINIIASSPNDVFIGLSAGEYLVEVLDANLCSVNVPITLTEQEPLVSTVALTDVLCLPDSGVVTIAATGGTPPYQYRVNDGVFQTANIFTSLSTGIYTIETVDSLGCSVLIEVSIEEPFPLILELNNDIEYISESDNSIMVSVVGGVLPLQYQLTGTNIESRINDTGVFSQVPQGEYSIQVIDNVGCTFTNVLVISYDDSNSDGISDNDEDVNGNGILDDDDTDEDGIPDYLDDDDDNDGVDSVGEIEVSGRAFAKTGENFLDTDGDDIPNHRDMDDDDDGILTIDEDYNGNGDPTDDDTDNSGIADYLEKGVALSIQENQLADSFSFFPNPTETNITIEFDDIEGEYIEITVFDLQGKKMLNRNGISGENKLIMDVSSISSGMYLLKINNGKNSGVKKLLIN